MIKQRCNVKIIKKHISELLASFPFLFQSYAAPRDLHSFPTRRSSDLEEDRDGTVGGGVWSQVGLLLAHDAGRSEEHTPELQSPYDLVCRLLLEKKREVE